jgi:hypothetical protein
MKMSPVVHFEMPAADKKRMSDFYTRVFGWHTQQLGPEMGNYVLVHTTETTEDGMIREPGRINGGFTEKSKENPSTNVVIAVDDIRDAMRRIAAAGGTLLNGQDPGQPDEIPGVGLYVSFLDTEGNRVGVLQPSAMDAPAQGA